jgi:hypothetical protein
MAALRRLRKIASPSKSQCRIMQALRDLLQDSSVLPKQCPVCSRKTILMPVIAADNSLLFMCRPCIKDLQSGGIRPTCLGRGRPDRMTVVKAENGKIRPNEIQKILDKL